MTPSIVETAAEVPIPYVAPAGNKTDFGITSWPVMATEVATPQQKRTEALAKFPHAAVAPGGIENISADEFESIFGTTAAQRYAEDEQQKHSEAFEPRAYEFLQLVRQSRQTATSIAQALLHIAETQDIKPSAGLIEAWQNFPGRDAPERFEALRSQTVEYLSQITAEEKPKANTASIKRITGKISELLKAPPIRTSKPMTFMLRELAKSQDTPPPDGLIEAWEKLSGEHASEHVEQLKTRTIGYLDQVHSASQPSVGHAERIAELLIAPHVHNKFDMLTSRQACHSIIDIESRWRQKTVPGNDHEGMPVRLENLKALAASGLFCTDDLMKIAVGEPDFSENLSKTLIGDGRKAKNSEVYYAFYPGFQKIFPDFIKATIGQTLFAFDDTKPIQDWTVDDIARLKQFAQSRYQMVHDVFETLANKEKNPLGDLKNLAIPGFAHEVLRASLYRNWKLEIRVGIGGTIEEDPLIRACAYVAGPLQFMQVFDAINRRAQASGIAGINVPTLVVFDGSALAVEVNEIDPAAAKRNGQNFLNLMQKFIGHFFSDMQSRVTFEQPEYHQVFDNEVFPLLREATCELREAARKLLARDVSDVVKSFESQAKLSCGNKGELARIKAEQYAERALGEAREVVEFFETLAVQAEKHDCGNKDDRAPVSAEQYAERALCYAAAHLMPRVFGTIAEEFAYPVLKWGGQGEEAFDVVQRKVLKLLFTKINNGTKLVFPHAVGPNVDALCVTGPVGGHPPVYYFDETEYDLRLRQTQQDIADGKNPGSKFTMACGEVVANGARNDMMMMLATRQVGGWQNFEPFLMQCAL